MFTGIVERTGRVARLSEGEAGARRLRVADVGPIADESALGASISVSGVCLTVAATGSDWIEFDLIRETLVCSTLGDLREGDRVNLERSLRVGDRLDGHFLQGHVDGIAVVARVLSTRREHVVWLRPEPEVKPYIIPKGSIAIDGVSLTVAAVSGEEFSVALIPTTLEVTTFSSLRVGDQVNIESDIIVRAIVHHLEGGGTRPADGSSLTLDKLTEAGFL